ncbi:MAG: hypothetical protein JW717_12215 [Marinilabiliaceae bacterium]|nr:hypothetical protein [Marinilabiliaceae bacterium]
MSFTKTRLLILFLIGINTYINAQNTSPNKFDKQTFSMYREPSYITFAGGIGNIENLIFEANIIPYYLLSINQESRWGIELSPQVILRMYNIYSLPVRTPSFMPRATVFYQFRKNKTNADYNDIFGYLTLCHHSNGQEDSFFNADSSTVNVNSGNFSTNMIEGGVFLSRPNRFNPYSVHYLKLSSVYHFQHIDELENKMGDLRFFADIQTTVDLTKTLEYLNIRVSHQNKKSAILNFSSRIGWIAGPLSDADNIDVKRLIFKHTISYKPTFMSDVTFFVQYYYGQDYYNIYFARQLNVLRFGITAKASSVF